MLNPEQLATFERSPVPRSAPAINEPVDERLSPAGKQAETCNVTDALLRDCSLSKSSSLDILRAGFTEAPAGLVQVLKEDWKNPSGLLELLAGSAIIGVALRTVLPRTGRFGSVLSGVLSAAATARSLHPLQETFLKAQSAKTDAEKKNCSRNLGAAIGEFAHNLILSQYGYKAGCKGADKLLLKIASAEWGELRNHTSKAAPTKHMAASEPSNQATLTLMVKSKGSVVEMEKTLKMIADGKQEFLSDAEFSEKFGADPEALARLAKFAQENGLQISEADPRSGRVVIQGTNKQLSEVFKAKLQDSESIPKEIFKPAVEVVTVPEQLSGDIEGIFGLDNRVIARPHLQISKSDNPGDARTGYLPTQVANAYEIPAGPVKSNFAVAILEFGGGIRMKDQAQYYNQHGFKVPKINVLEVGEGENAPWDPSGANAEVSLDSQVIGAIAPELEQNIIFSRNNEKGFLDAVNRAIFQQPGETQNVSISISWGSPVERWSPQARDALNLAFKKANLKGISVFAASGDGGALDDGRSGKYTTTYPSSDPNVSSCGGTELRLSPAGKIESEIGWTGSGGGISEIIPQPDFQKGLRLPPNANGNPMIGRAVPDISANASFSTSYLIRVDGQEKLIGGTSAVAPLMAALNGNISEILGRPAGINNPFLYKNAGAGIFNDITTGNNGAYQCSQGYDPVTGWGSVNGRKLLELLENTERQ